MKEEKGGRFIQFDTVFDYQISKSRTTKAVFFVAARDDAGHLPSSTPQELSSEGLGLKCSTFQRARVLEIAVFIARSENMWNAFWIFVGGGLGSLGRWWFSGWIANAVGQTFPWGTLIVNVSGSFVIGLFSTISGPQGRWTASPTFRQFFMLGVCGGYTTFSSFSLQTLMLAEEGEWFKAAGNCALSLVLCLLGVWLGHVAALQVNAIK